MTAVIFEGIPLEGRKNEYLSIAVDLKPHLMKMDGFVSIERYESLYNPGKILSLSFWKDDESVKNWRNTELHREAQIKGRQSIFKDYRIRIAEVTRDYGISDREQAPDDSKLFHQS